MEILAGKAFSFSPALNDSSKPIFRGGTILANLHLKYSENCFRKLSFSSLRTIDFNRPGLLRASNASENFSAADLQSGSSLTKFDIDQVLKDKAKEISMRLDGRNLYLIGLMAAGKTTIGKLLAELLGFRFADSDEHVKQQLGVKSINGIFEAHGESFFRYYEVEALRTLSLTPRQVISTGGGIILQRANWEYMKQGVTILLKVPLHVSAERIARYELKGLDDRKIDGSGNGYTTAFKKLLFLYKSRKAAYANADVTVSLHDIGIEMNLDASEIPISAIVLEILVRIEKFLNVQDKRNTDTQVSGKGKLR